MIRESCNQLFKMIVCDQETQLYVRRHDRMEPRVAGTNPESSLRASARGPKTDRRFSPAVQVNPVSVNPAARILRQVGGPDLE
jgi:hypothetical protein